MAKVVRDVSENWKQRIECDRCGAIADYDFNDLTYDMYGVYCVGC